MFYRLSLELCVQLSIKSLLSMYCISSSVCLTVLQTDSKLVILTMPMSMS